MTQGAFRNAVLAPQMPVPAGLTDGEGHPAGRRFAVYRNNVAVSLTAALETGFPVVQKLVGAEFFAALAGVFLRAYPPRSPVLMLYGAEMPDFLSDFAPVRGLPYLPDVARLELALRTAYHAANAQPLAQSNIASIPPERLVHARLRLAPALVLVRSAHPLYDIWRAQTGPAAAPIRPDAQDVVVLRPAFDPAPHLLAPGGAAFIAALQQGEPLGHAADAAGPEHDLSATLGLLIAGGAMIDLEFPA